MLAGDPCKLVLNSLVGYGYGQVLKRKSRGVAFAYSDAGVGIELEAEAPAFDTELLAQEVNNPVNTETANKVVTAASMRIVFICVKSIKQFWF